MKQTKPKTNRILFLILPYLFINGFNCDIKKILVERNLQQYKEDEKIEIAPLPEPLNTFSFEEPFKVDMPGDGKSILEFTLILGYANDKPELEKELLKKKEKLIHIVYAVAERKTTEDLQTSIQKMNFFDEIRTMINMVLESGKIEEVMVNRFEINP